ncbi:Eukaryotic translation initiation factor 5 [Glycine soja]|uniref:Eukaryotic translation initiation factor 5 n=1 Tax=Glycine soja TaxID=3848 RepID=A0A0B2PV01_GLYSO|nr:Eukaryotic translation initiation factor 5 [Glycine soja]
MALQNIGAANSDDAFYRYKMPRMITKIEGRGNGIKTNVVNMVIKNPPEVKKGSKDKKAMRRAEKEGQKEGELADEEQKKVKKEVKKKGSSSSKDGTAKSTSPKKKASGSDEDRTSPTHSQIDEEEEAPDEDDGDDDVQWLTDTSLDAARQRIQEQLSAVTADMVMLSTDEPEKKKKAASNGNGGSQNGNSMHYKTLVGKVKANLKKGIGANELLSHLSAHPAPAQEKMSALVEALFEGTEKGFAKEADKKKNYFSVAVADEGSQPLLLHAIEEFSCKSTSNALKEVALVLKALYDADVLEEEHIVLWYQKGLKGDNKNSKTLKNAQPFIDWLQSAESETEEE